MKTRLLIIIGIIIIPTLLGAFYLFSENPSGIITQYTEFTNDDSSDEKDFVFAFYSEIAKDSPESNLFLSPFGISTAFSMAYEGAAGNTASEMQQVFGFISDDQKRRESISDTLAKLDSKNNMNTRLLPIYYSYTLNIQFLPMIF